MKPPSKRFNPNRWTEWVIPALLILLLIGLLATIAIIALSVFGLTPGM